MSLRLLEIYIKGQKAEDGSCISRSHLPQQVIKSVKGFKIYMNWKREASQKDPKSLSTFIATTNLEVDGRSQSGSAYFENEGDSYFVSLVKTP